MEYIVIFLIICFIIIWVFVLIVFKNCRAEFCLGNMLGAIIIAYIFSLADMSKPTTLDAYKGKTTLEITLMNGVPQDTVVIYKK